MNKPSSGIREQSSNGENSRTIQKKTVLMNFSASLNCALVWRVGEWERERERDVVMCIVQFMLCIWMWALSIAMCFVNVNLFSIQRDWHVQCIERKIKRNKEISISIPIVKSHADRKDWIYCISRRRRRKKDSEREWEGNSWEFDIS